LPVFLSVAYFHPDLNFKGIKYNTKYKRQSNIKWKLTLVVLLPNKGDRSEVASLILFSE
jgi:hypothetical protein